MNMRGLGNPKSPKVSVSAKTYARIAAAAKKYGCTKADIVREACAGILVEPRR